MSRDVRLNSRLNARTGQSDQTDQIDQILVKDLTTPVPPEVSAFTAQLAESFPHLPLGVLFYGSQSRAMNPDGLLDFYVVFEKSSDLPGSFFERLGNRLLPPNVIYRAYDEGVKKLRAKVALLTLEQFRERSGVRSLDTTIWARFCQPVRLVWVNSPSGAEAILASLHRCILTAATWAALLGPKEGTPEVYWHALFSATYAAELRVERKGRSRNLLQGQEGRYAELLCAAWKELGLNVAYEDERLRPVITVDVRNGAEKRWKKITETGKRLNLARLLKAAFTFRGGVAYLLWKIRRHTGQDISVTSFERRHPILALPSLLWRFRKVRRDTNA